MVEDGSLRSVVAVERHRSRAVPGAVVLRVERFGRALHEPVVPHIATLSDTLRRANKWTLALQVALFDEDTNRREQAVSAWCQSGFRRTGSRSYQQTLRTELLPDEDSVWGAFSQSARRGVRSFERVGGRILRLSDPVMVPWIRRLHGETFDRTGGKAPILELCVADPRDLIPQRCAVFLAFAESGCTESSLVSFGVVRVHGDHAVYEAGGSRRLQGDAAIIGGYSIMWECMRWAIQQNCTWFDLGGSVDLEDRRYRHLAGIEEFKRRFSKVRLSVGDEVVCEPSRLLAGLAQLNRAVAGLVRRSAGRTP